MNINNITIVGRLTSDPELTHIGEKNTAKTELKVAVNRIGQKDKTDFIPVVVFGTQAENANKYLIKGQEVGVTGSLQIDTWKKDDKWYSKAYVFASSVQFGNKPNGKQEETRDEEPETVPF